MTIRHPLRVISLGLALGSGILGFSPVTVHASSSVRVSGVVHSMKGWTIVALGASNGKASTTTITTSGTQRFSMPLPATTWTMQFITPKGTYGGELVAAKPFVAARFTLFHTGFSGALNLGAITYHPRYKFATTTDTRGLVSSRWAFSVGKGAALRPAGNGQNVGLVSLTALIHASAHRGHACPSTSGVGGDGDCSGVANLFNLAPAGDRIISALRPHQGTRVTTHLSGTSATGVSPWMSQLFLYVDHAVNADVAGVSPSTIDTTLENSLNVKLLGLPPSTNVTSSLRVDLNCNGLSFCSPNGTGQAVQENGLAGAGGTFHTVPFPSSYVDPANGFGEIIGPAAPSNLLGSNPGAGQEFSLNPGAPSSAIGSGDVITVATSSDGGVTWQQTPTTIEFVFVTVPAITSVTDTTGASNVVDYSSASPLGSSTNPMVVHPDPTSGHVVITFNFFRPQRAGLAGAGETPWMDIGHLWYALNLGGVGACSLGSYLSSSLSPTLSLVNPQSLQGSGATAPPPGAGMLVDSAGDHPASSSSSNELSFSVDLTQCYLDAGRTLPVGTPFPATDLEAASPNSPDHANEQFWMEVAP